MSNLTNRLRAQTSPADDSSFPVFFRLRNASDRAALSELIERVISIQVLDQIEMQIRDLVKLENPTKTLTDEDYALEISNKLGGLPSDEYGVWVYYPWRKQLIHLLDEEEFIRVRTIRNAYKITFEEQAILRTKKIGVIGLSVGQSVSLALAMERIAGEIRIADFDTLELSNMNRIRTGIYNLGLKKTAMVAREIAEIDPFIKVIRFDKGISLENIDSFFDKGGRLDLLVEECDGIDIKILAREKAREKRIPVVMDTSDRGMLDIEMYDSEPEYPIFHGLVDPEISYTFLKTLKTSEEKLPYILPIVGSETISTAFKSSLLEVGQTISTWPQLASDVNIGGSIAALTAKQIMLGKSVKSGRKWFDAEEMLFAGKQDHQEIILNELPLEQRTVEKQIEVSGASMSTVIPENQLITDMVGEATRSSSPGNTQKWKWVWKNATLFLFIDKQMEIGFSDNFSFGSMMAMGMALEQIRISASHRQMNAQVVRSDMQKTPHLIAYITFHKASEVAYPYQSLFAYLNNRTTSRAYPSRTTIPALKLKEILQELETVGLKFKLITDTDQIDELGVLIRKGDRIRLTNKYGHADFYGNELRITKEENEAHRDGIDAATLNLTPKESAGLQLAKDSKAIDYLSLISGGKGFEQFSEKAIESASAIVVIFAPDMSRARLITVGEALHRTWLQATRLEVGLHPMTVLQMLFSYLLVDKHNYIQVREKAEIERLKKNFDLLFPEFVDQHSLFTFRLFPDEMRQNETLRKPTKEKLLFL
ncbi:MAG: Rv1355c family protein [Flavobacteriales bacterium]